jgi:hypothetical protein
VRTAHPLTPATVQVQCDESAEAAAYWGLGLKPGATIYTGQVCRCVRCCSRVCVCACSQCAWGGAAQVMGWAEIDDEGQVKYEALELLEQRWSGSTAEWEYRVRWVGYGADADTWEREGSLPGGRRGELVRRFRQDRAVEAGLYFLLPLLCSYSLSLLPLIVLFLSSIVLFVLLPLFC